jgi:hypothetical protein
MTRSQRRLLTTDIRAALASHDGKTRVIAVVSQPRSTPLIDVEVFIDREGRQYPPPHNPTFTVFVYPSRCVVYEINNTDLGDTQIASIELSAPQVVGPAPAQALADIILSAINNRIERRKGAGVRSR